MTDDIRPDSGEDTMADSRRDALKKLGVGAAGAAAIWAAPSVLSSNAASAASGNPLVPCNQCSVELLQPAAGWLPLTGLEASGIIPGCVGVPFVGEVITDLVPGPGVNMNMPFGGPSCAIPPLLPFPLPNASGAVSVDITFLAWLFNPAGPPPPLQFPLTNGCDNQTFTVNGVVNGPPIPGSPGLFCIALFFDGAQVVTAPFGFPPPVTGNPPPLSFPVPAGSIGYLGFIVANLTNSLTYDIDITSIGITSC